MSEIRELALSELNPPLKPTLINDLEGLERVKDFVKRTPTYGLDTETNVVSSFVDRKIRTIQVGSRDEQYVIDLLPFAGCAQNLVSGQGNKKPATWAEPIVEALKPGLESGDSLKVGQNLQFDYEVLRWCLGLRAWNLYCTQLAEKVIYCGRVHFMKDGFWALDDLVERYCRLRIKKALQSSFDLETPLTQEQIDYAALDTRLPLAVRAGQLGVIQKAGLERCARLENEAIPAFGDLHLNGFKLDRDRWRRLIEINKKNHAENVKELDKHFVSVVGRKSERPTFELDRLERAWRDEKDREARAAAREDYKTAKKALTTWDKQAPTFEGEAAINYGAHPQLLAALRKMGFDAKILPSTNDKILSGLSTFPVIEAVRNYRETEKQLDTYGENFLDHINPLTERVHSNISQLGAATGRTSSSKPNIQNIPKGSDWRKCFVARPGYKLVTVDMSGAELRIIAELSKDQVWVEAFKNDWDVHSIGAQMMYGKEWDDSALPECAFIKSKKKCKCPKHEELRDKIKAINFGVAYGMEENALAGRLKITKKAAGALLTLWRAANAVVNRYLKQSGEYGKTHLEARTLCGRRRLFTKPTWESAKESAKKYAAENGRNPEMVGTKEINRAYILQYAAIEREAKNTPIQGTNADIVKLALTLMWPRLEPEFGAFLVNTVHDEIVVEAPEDRAEDVFKFVGECIKAAAAEFMKLVEMDYEGGISNEWSKK